MADTQTNHLGLYRIGAATDNVGVHMIEHYNANMTALDTFIAAHDIASISISGGTLTITATDGTTYTASIDANDINYSNSESGLTATQIQAAIDEVVTALGGKQGTLRAGDNITINGNTISATDTKDAERINFDNTNSGLTATDVQEAIDEVVTDLAEKQDALTEGDHIDITDDTISVDTTDSIDHVSKTVTGDIISITDGGDGFPVENLTINIDPVQSGSGDPSPDNVRPISGWTEANVERCGKNLFDIQSLVAAGITFADGVLTGTAGRFHDGYTSGIPISFKNTQYVLSFQAYTDGNDGTIDTGLILSVYYTDGVREGIEIPNSTSAFTYFSIASNPNKEITKITISFGRWRNNVWHIKDLQLELGSTATTYEPYQGTTYNLAWQSSAGTVYGGTLDVTSGVLTVDRASVDLGDLTWEYYNNTFFYSHIEGRKTNSSISCSNYAYEGTRSDSQMSSANIGIYTGYSAREIKIKDTSYTDIETFRTAMSGVQLVYELETPLTYQLTPTEVTTLLGNNTLWADTGDSTLVYNTDTDDIIPTSEAVVDYVAPTKAVADSIKCTETTAGTYTLSATVDADGNVTYAWS